MKPVKTMLYRLGLPALLVHRPNIVVVLRDGPDERNGRGVGGRFSAPTCFGALLPTVARQ